MADQLYDLKNVPIFSTGTWNNDVYTEADLDHMVAAYGLVGFKPPVKLGHDESQPMAKSDSMPSLGWVTNLRRIGQKLYADITALPRKVYDAIRRKNYDRVSAEVYWDYSEGGRKLPRVLKALALLGAEIPAVTNLDTLQALYDASGKPFKRYDLGLLPMPQEVPPPLIGTVSDGYDDEEGLKKDRAGVNYRPGGADDDGDGVPDRCGSCRFFDGAPDPYGTMASIGNCALVEGQIASTWLCDLYEPMEAFSAASRRGRARTYDASNAPWNGDKSRYDLDQLKRAVPSAVRSWAEGRAKDNPNGEVVKDDLKFPYKEPDGTVNLNGVRAALAAMGGARTGKKPSDIPAEVIAKARDQLQGILSREGGNPAVKKLVDSQEARTFTLPAEAVRRLCPGCAERMDFLNIRELKITYDPVKKTYMGFSQGLCDHFGNAQGFRTRCMADGKLAASVDDIGAFCNALKEFCFGSVAAESRAQAAKVHSDAVGGAKTLAGMTVVEKDGQFCVTADGKDVKCFPTKDEADAYLETEGGDSEHMKEHEAKIKELTDQLAAASKARTDAEAKTAKLSAEVATLSAKVPELEKYVSDSEAEKARLQEEVRKSANQQWLKTHTAEGSVRILPVEAPLVAYLLDQLTQSGGPTLKAYTTVDGKELSAVDTFKSIFERRKPGSVLLYEEVSKGRATETGGDPTATEKPIGMSAARAEATARAKKYMQEKGEKSFKVAMAAVYAADPELRDIAAGVTEEGAGSTGSGKSQMGRLFKK